MSHAGLCERECGAGDPPAPPRHCWRQPVARAALLDLVEGRRVVQPATEHPRPPPPRAWVRAARRRERVSPRVWPEPRTARWVEVEAARWRAGALPSLLRRTTTEIGLVQPGRAAKYPSMADAFAWCPSHASTLGALGYTAHAAPGL